MDDDEEHFHRLMKSSTIRRQSVCNTQLPISDDDDGSSCSSTSYQRHARKILNNGRVRISIGGHVHETFIATLNRIPNTRLSKLAQNLENDPSYIAETGEFFFNRNPEVFTSIIQFYRTGELHIDNNICGNAIKNVSFQLKNKRFQVGT